MLNKASLSLAQLQSIVHVQRIWNSPTDKAPHLGSFEPRHEISNNLVCATSKASDQPACTRSLIRTFAFRLNILGVLSY